ncbi:MAG: ParA family partition ATPase [Pseudomonadota bacterium]
MASQGRVILFAQQKGGAGKSTLVTQLAVALSQAGDRVRVIDLDPQRSTTDWFGVRTKQNGAIKPTDLDLVDSTEWRARSDILHAAREADFVLVDSPGAAGAVGRGAMRTAQFALIPCQPSAPDIWASADTLDMVRREKLPHAVVLNRVPPRGRVVDSATGELLNSGAPVMSTRIGARLAFCEAFMSGTGVTEIAGRSPAAHEIRTLARALDSVVAHA